MTITTQVLVETPESVDLQAEPAGVVARGLAYLIDLIIRIIAQILLLIVLAILGRAGMGVYLIIMFLSEWFYPVIFEVYFRGQTPGKKMMGLAVVNDDLTPISWGTSMIRNLLRIADFFPFLFVTGIITMACNDKFQRLGDIAAGTLVVYRNKDEEQTAPPSTAKARPSPVQLEREDQIAIIGFTQRQNQLSEDRQQELADILNPILPSEGGNNVGYLRGIGRWLLGER